MNDIKLIYFSGCQNFNWVKELILELGIPFEEIDQNDLPEEHPLRSYTSPSILKNSELVMGYKAGTSKGSCSIYLPSRSGLKEKLKK